jgi:serine/threonine-protein kinase
VPLDIDLVVQALSSYDIGSEIGRGGWGIVLAGKHRHLGREVAIKQLPRAFAADPEVRARFLAEARLLAALDHPHIVPVYDFVERDGLCLLVMERLSGGTVWSRFVEHGVSAETACAIGIATAVALHHAHEHGVLHRDIKPENLLFAKSGVIKVTDFGIAKVLGGSDTVATRAGDVLGTPAYMAPEQAVGGDLGPPTDIYSLGVMLFELLSGRLPFDHPGDSPLTLLYMHVHEPPPNLGDLVPARVAPLVPVVMRALAKDPTARCADGMSFARAIAEAATEAFGPGWLGRCGAPVMAAGDVVAITERPGAPSAPMVATVDDVVAVARGHHEAPVSRAIVTLEPADLVPVNDLAAPGRPPLRELSTALSRAGTPEAMRLAGEVERLESGAHVLRELQLLQRHRSGGSPFRPADWHEVEAVLGAYGTSAAERAGLPVDAPLPDVRAALVAALDKWQRRAESPMSSRALADAARVLIRTCEGLLAGIDG